MRYLFVTFLLTTALFFGAPKAQAQEDFVVIPDAGIYTLKATWDDTDYAQVCFVDMGTSLDLICTSTPEADLHPDTGGQYVMVQVTVVNPGHDVEIRAYATDASGNKSDFSPNKATADFTAPNAPFMLR